MFDINVVTTIAQEATNKLIEQIKVDGIDRDFVAEFKAGVEFKVYIQPDQINCALSCGSLREWLNGFFVEGDDSMNSFEQEFFDVVFNYASQHSLFTDVEEIDTRMWIIDEPDSHTPNAIFYAYAETDTDYDDIDYGALEKVMMSAYGVMILAHTWLEAKRSAQFASQSVAMC